VPTPSGAPTQYNGHAAGCGCLLAILVLCGASFAVYSLLDASGWISHAKSVDLYVSGEWAIGERRSCLGLQSRLPGEPPSITSLDCRVEGYTETPYHQTTVVDFFGKISRPDLVASNPDDFEWRCKRDKHGFTCYAMN
jgi:hypothetical protein